MQEYWTIIGGFWRRYKRNKSAMIGFLIIASTVLIAVIAPLATPYNPGSTAYLPLVSLSSSHYMGTDDLGRDVFSRFLMGARVSLLVGITAAVTSMIIGIIIGALSGYYGGWIDDILMRITEFFMIIPSFFLALVMVAVFGTSIWNIIFVIGILSWPRTARLVRSEYLSLREREFILAARALGSKDYHIIFRELLPNSMSPVIVTASLQIAAAILIESGLSFLGLGDLSNVSWGQMLNEAEPFLGRAWWMALFPGFAILLTVLGFNLVGDGLNDTLNPKMKGR